MEKEICRRSLVSDQTRSPWPHGVDTQTSVRRVVTRAVLVPSTAFLGKQMPLSHRTLTVSVPAAVLRTFTVTQTTVVA